MKTEKTVVNWFVDFDKEEEWLNEMSRNGWCLWHANVYIYRFKKCEPGEYIFQIDFDEDYINDSNEDYVIYWKRKAAEGPFENGENVSAKLRLANKFFSQHFNSLTGMIYTGILGLLLQPVLNLLPECGFTNTLTEICTGLPIVFLLAIGLVQFPIIIRLHKKMNDLIRRML